MFELLRKDDDKNVIEQGFTLVELLIVVVILGILAGVVVFAVGGLRTSSQTTACDTEVKTIETAVDAYGVQNPGPPPANMAALVGADLIKEDTGHFTLVAGAPVAAVGGPCV